MLRLRIATLSLITLVMPIAFARAQVRDQAPPARARCNDGTLWRLAERANACAAHGGVKEWLAAARHDWPEGTTARCTDDTMYSGTDRHAACEGHHGVKQWRNDDDQDNARPRNATARCNDGSWYTSTQRPHACASNGGVKHWLGNGHKGDNRRGNGRGNGDDNHRKGDAAASHPSR